MSNSYFQFKQFRIDQDRCAMKVTTDACIQGVWTPIAQSCKNVLDIGCGTGLLSLLLAQRSPALSITGIELDESAAAQAQENVSGSRFAHQIKIINGDANTYDFKQRYDLIICNPPFFNNSLLGPVSEKNQARHTITLSQQQLLNICSQNLAPNGIISILLPTTEYQHWITMARAANWHEICKLSVWHDPLSPAKRVISLLGREAVKATTDQQLVIYDSEKNYSADFKQLFADYYLNF